MFGEIVPQQGVRQGDPISLYIYIMCVEGLSSIIRRNEGAKLLHGCMIANEAPILSHLLFEDDCYLFFKATRAEADVMKRILHRYEAISGQKINFDKFAIAFSPNNIDECKREVCDQLGVSGMHSPKKYLGMPMVVGRNKSANFWLAFYYFSH